MSQYYFFILTIFGFFLYFVVTDSSAAAFVDLIAKLGRFHYEKTKWWMLHNPRNIIVRWMMYRNSMRMAEELMKEFEGRDKWNALEKDGILEE
jgi:hypothetical protein